MGYNVGFDFMRVLHRAVHEQAVYSSGYTAFIIVMYCKSYYNASGINGFSLHFNNASACGIKLNTSETYVT